MLCLALRRPSVNPTFRIDGARIGGNSDGTIKGLYLFPPPTGQWILRFVSHKTSKQRDMGLGSYPTVSIRMLELLILTASRSGEVRQMRWEEIDFSGAVWIVPASRMKAKVIHRVPLAARGIEMLEHQLQQSATGEGLVFPSRKNTPVSDMTLTKLLRDQKMASDVAERALAHTVRNAVEAAYHRTDLLEQRRSMMISFLPWVGGSTTALTFLNRSMSSVRFAPQADIAVPSVWRCYGGSSDPHLPLRGEPNSSILDLDRGQTRP